MMFERGLNYVAVLITAGAEAEGCAAPDDEYMCPIFRCAVLFNNTGVKLLVRSGSLRQSYLDISLKT